MKKTIITVFLISCYWSGLYAQIFSGNCDGGRNIVPTEDMNICNSSDWALVFEDNFDSDTLNTDKWKLNNQPGSLVGGDHQNVVTLRNAVIIDGILSLFAKEEHVQELVNPDYDSTYIFSDGLPNYRWFEYTSGLIYSVERFGFGYFEASCKVPSGKGLWPAMWMYGSHIDIENNRYSHEIDVFEFWKDKPKELNMNVHYDGEACLTDYNGPDFSKEFHTYGLLWEPNKIEWYLDGELIRSDSRYYQNGANVGCKLNAWQVYQEIPFPQGSMSLIFNIAVDNRDGHRPDETTQFPKEFQIDYIRYYVREGLMDLKPKTNFYSHTYPNPAQNKITVELENNSYDDIYLEIYSIHSELLLNENVFEKESTIDISALKNGVYLLRLISNQFGILNSQKLIVSR